MDLSIVKKGLWRPLPKPMSHEGLWGECDACGKWDYLYGDCEGVIAERLCVDCVKKGMEGSSEA